MASIRIRRPDAARGLDRPVHPDPTGWRPAAGRHRARCRQSSRVVDRPGVSAESTGCSNCRAPSGSNSPEPIPGLSRGSPQRRQACRVRRPSRRRKNVLRDDPSSSARGWVGSTTAAFLCGRVGPATRDRPGRSRSMIRIDQTVWTGPKSRCDWIGRSVWDFQAGCGCLQYRRWVRCGRHDRPGHPITLVSEHRSPLLSCAKFLPPFRFVVCRSPWSPVARRTPTMTLISEPSRS